MAVKAEFVNPFISGAIATITQEISESPRVGLVTATADSPRCDGVSVLITLSGQVLGFVIYNMTEKTAKSIAGRMAGAAVPLLDDLAVSAIAELGNMITGQAGSELELAGYRAKLSVPAVISGQGTILAEASVPQLIVPLATTFGNINIHISLHKV